MIVVGLARAVGALEVVAAERLLPLVVERAIDLAVQRDAQLVERAAARARAARRARSARDVGAGIAGEQQRAAHLDDALDLRLARQLVAADVLHLLRVRIEVRVEQLVGDASSRHRRLAGDTERTPFRRHLTRYHGDDVAASIASSARASAAVTVALEDLRRPVERADRARCRRGAR